MFETTDPGFDPGTEVPVQDDGIFDFLLPEMAPSPESGVENLPNFSPEAGTPLAGDPGAEMAVWHQQEGADTCAVVTQEFVLESLTGIPFDENELKLEAETNGWYSPGGTSLANMDKLLEAHGVQTETHLGSDLDTVARALENGDKVIVSVDSSEIWQQGEDLEDAMDIPGQGSDHAVEVTGIVSTPDGDMVVINDPGHPDGRGEMIPVAEFEAAWADSGNFTVFAGPGAIDSVDALPA